jgi:hypothetical protein
VDHQERTGPSRSKFVAVKRSVDDQDEVAYGENKFVSRRPNISI